MENGFAVQIGQVVAGGRYRLTGELGRGGFGIVYRAEQIALGREVALKLLMPTLRDPEKALLRFRREAELAQRLEHPNTVRIYDFGQLETGHWFIALEILRGLPLDAALHQAPLSPARTARVATQILKSLMEAHGRGVVHRDLKPQNVFLCDFSGETDFVKVLDFGVAKIHGEDDGKPVTHGGQIIGTPAYMAPEQVTGGAITPATDLYALGLVIAECLTGHAVVLDLSPIQACMLQSSAEPLVLEPAITMSAFGPIVARATQKNPAARYRSAEEMLHDVERLLSFGSNETALATLTLPRTSAPVATTPMPVRISQSPLAHGSIAPHGTQITPLVPGSFPPSAPPAGSILPGNSVAMNVAQQTISLPPPGSVVMSRGVFLTLLLLGGLLVVGAGASSAFYIYLRDQNARVLDATNNNPAQLDAAAPHSVSTLAPLNADGGPHGRSASLANFTMASAEKRFEKQGFQVTVLKQGPTNPGYKVETFTFLDGKATAGSVQFLDYQEEMAIDWSVAAANRSTNGAFVRDGHRFLIVYAMSYESSEALLPLALGHSIQ